MKHTLTIITIIGALLGLIASSPASAQIEPVALNIAKVRDTNLARGYDLHKKGQDADAELAFQKSIAKNPNSPYPYIALAQLYANDDSRFTDRIANLTKSIELSQESNPPAFAIALYERSMAYLDHRDRPEAYADALRLCTFCRKELGQFAEYKSLGHKAMAEYYIHADHDYYQASRDYADAADHLRRAVEYAPLDADLRYALAHALIESGGWNCYEEAREQAVIGLSLNPNHGYLRGVIARLDIREGDYSAAVDCLIDGLERDGVTTLPREKWEYWQEPWATWTEVLENAPLTLIAKLKAKMQANPEASIWPELLGLVYGDHNTPNSALAIQYFHKAFVVGGHPQDLYFELSALKEAGKLTATLNALDQFLTLDSTFAYAYALRADINTALDRHQTILADLNKAIGMEPHHSYYFKRACFERYNGMTESALADLTTAIQQYGRCTSYYVTRGDLYAQTGQPDLAREDYTTACRVAADIIERYPTYSHHDTAALAAEHQQYAFALLALGDTLAAQREILRGQTTTVRQRPAALYSKARLLALMNQKQEALAALSKALSAGYSDHVLIARDPALDNIRHTPEFPALLTRARALAQAQDSTAKNSTAPTPQYTPPLPVQNP